MKSPLRSTTLYLTLLLVVLFAGSSQVMSIPIQAQEEDEIPAWDQQSRFTVLVMGLDRRPREGSGLISRTDVMLLISIDPVEEQIGILHIPRDLRFNPVDNEALVLVNTLVQVGEQNEPGTGPYYAMDTLQYNLGMYIDRFVIFDFEAFIEVVDALGGIEITTTYIINDREYPDMNYGYDPFFLRAGTHQMDGRTALKFARTRHNDNDYLRGERQMQVLRAIHAKLTEEGALAQVLLRAPQIYSSLSRNVYTDLTLNDMMQLARFAVTIPEEQLSTGSINQQYNMTFTMPNGTNVFIPDREKLVELLTTVFGEHYAG